MALSGRTSAADWCAAGLVLLRDEGIESVTIDRLCAVLGKTKGSFYHHFEDLDAYLASLVARWEHEHTEAPIAAADRERDPRRRGARLGAVVKQLDHRIDLAVRAWAFHDRRARAALERVDRRRLAYLAGLHHEAGRRDPTMLAELEYAAFVGAQHLGLLADEARARRLERVLARALTVLGRARPSPGRRR